MGLAPSRRLAGGAPRRPSRVRVRTRRGPGPAAHAGHGRAGLPADWWEKAGQTAPADLPDLRGTLLTFRAGRSRLASPVLSLVPTEELFWDLAWSYEGRADASLYTYPKLQALRFLQEFDLVPRMEESSCAEALVEGTAGAAFVEASQVGSIVETAAKAGVPLTVAPIPGQGGEAICLYTGWCVVRTGGQGGAPRAWNALLGPSVQTTLARGGFLPLLKSARSPGGQGLWSALDRTRFQPPPDLGPDGDAVVRGAVSDATEAGMAPEEALRRAEARLREGMRP